MVNTLCILQNSSKDITRARGMLRKWASLSLDIETRGNIKDIYSHKIVLLQLGTHEHQIVIDARRVDILPFLTLIKDKEIIGHNLKFDLGVIYLNYGIKFSKVYDTMLAAYVLECGLEHWGYVRNKKGKIAPKRISRSLQEVARRYVDPYAYTAQGNFFMESPTKEVRKSFLKIMDEDYSQLQLTYGALDIYYAYRLYLYFKERLIKEMLTDTLDFEHKFLHVVIEMETNGMPINTEKWLMIAERNKEREQAALKKLEKEALINWNSPKQIVPIFKEIGISTSIIDKDTYELKDSVNALVLKKQIKKFHILEKYLEYKKYQKYASTYGHSYLDVVSTHTGRIHTSFVQILETGRTSSTSPNLQNIPARDTKEFRECFEAPEGRTFVIADFKNQELRVLADKANEPVMIKAFKDNKDIHLETAKAAFNNPLLEKDTKEREMAKSMNFLMAYGGGANKLSTNFGITLQQAKDLIAKYYEEFNSLAQYFNKVGDDAQSYGYISIDDVICRKSYIDNFERYITLSHYVLYCEHMGRKPDPKLEDEYNAIHSKIQRDAQNRPIQGTGANISKQAGILLYNHPKRYLYKILLLVHDEWILECADEDASEVKKILETCMLEASRVFCKNLDIPADGKINKIWIK